MSMSETSLEVLERLDRLSVMQGDAELGRVVVRLSEEAEFLCEKELKRLASCGAVVRVSPGWWRVTSDGQEQAGAYRRYCEQRR